MFTEVGVLDVEDVVAEVGGGYIACSGSGSSEDESGWP